MTGTLRRSVFGCQHKNIVDIYNGTGLALKAVTLGVHMQAKLRLATIELLRNRPRHVRLIDLAEQADVGQFWLVRFSQGDFKDPGVDKIERLYMALTGRELAL